MSEIRNETPLIEVRNLKEHFPIQVSVLKTKPLKAVDGKEILTKLDGMFPQSTTVSIQEAIYLGDIKLLQRCLNKLLIQSVSYFDTVGENFYHGFMLGLCAMFDNRYFVSSNREAGDGRYDIAMFPKDKKLPGIIFELKAKKDCSDRELKKLAQEALNQIYERKYEVQMKEYDAEKILCYGVAFSGKKVEIVEERIEK